VTRVPATICDLDRPPTDPEVQGLLYQEVRRFSLPSFEMHYLFASSPYTKRFVLYVPLVSMSFDFSMIQKDPPLSPLFSFSFPPDAALRKLGFCINVEITLAMRSREVELGSGRAVSSCPLSGIIILQAGAMIRSRLSWMFTTHICD